MNDNVFTIRLDIAGKIYPLRIERQHEGRAREAAKLISELVAKYQEKYDNSDLEIKDFFAFAAFQSAYQYFDKAEEKNTEPILDRIADLNSDLEEFLKGK